MKKIVLGVLLAIAVAAIALTIAVTMAESSRSFDRIALGTACSVTIYNGSNIRKADTTSFWASITDLENRISVTLPYTEISMVNENAGNGRWIEVSEDTYDLISFSLDMCEMTGGAFCPVMGRLIDLWGIGTESPRVPDQKDVECLLPCYSSDCIRQKVLLRSSADDSRTVFSVQLTDPNAVLNLGAVGKGWASDVALTELREMGISSATVNFGGNVGVLGSKPKGFGSRPFRIGIQDPLKNRCSYFAAVDVEDCFVVTSGSYERCFQDKDGKTYSHIIDPWTGYPVQSDVLSVTVIGPVGAVCDVLSTSCFVLGYEESKAMMGSSFPDYTAIFVMQGDNGSSYDVHQVGNGVKLQ